MEGKQVTVEEVMVELRKDIPFYENSGGGITLSGGEPTFQADFALALLKQCKEEDLHTALDTCGQTAWQTYEKMLPFVDLVLYDLKHMHPERHRDYTGVSNDLILENLRKLSHYGVPIEIRMPIIPSLNDREEWIDAAAEFVSSLTNIERVRLLGYHRLGEGKYDRLERDNLMPSVTPPDKEHLEQLAERMKHYGLKVSVG